MNIIKDLQNIPNNIKYGYIVIFKFNIPSKNINGGLYYTKDNKDAGLSGTMNESFIFTTFNGVERFKQNHIKQCELTADLTYTLPKGAHVTFLSQDRVIYGLCLATAVTIRDTSELFNESPRQVLKYIDYCIHIVPIKYYLVGDKQYIIGPTDEGKEVLKRAALYC